MTDVGSQASLSRLELIVLARLSSAKQPESEDLGAAVSTFVKPAESPARARKIAAETRIHLHSRGLVADRPLPRRKSSARPAKRPRKRKTPPPRPPQPGHTLTDTGRRALCAALELDEAPTWDRVRNVHLPALALGLPPGSDDARKLLGLGKKSPVGAIAAAVLRMEYGTPKASSAAELGDALIAEALGLPSGPITLKRIRAHLIARRAELEPGAAPAAAKPDPEHGATRATVKGDPEQVATRAAMKALRARGADKRSIVQALARRWASAADPQRAPAPPPSARGSQVPVATPTQHASPPAATPVSSPPPPLTADALLALVREVIPGIGSDGRFGPEKVFISSIWHRLERDGRVPDFSLDRFKQWLLDANRERLLDLVRADLVGAMDPRLVAESEIEDLGSTFHFVLDHQVGSPGPDRRSHAR
jgi:hypothetical protein